MSTRTWCSPATPDSMPDQRFYAARFIRVPTGNLTIEEDSWAGIGWKLHFGRVINPNTALAADANRDGGWQPQALYTTPVSPG